VIFGKEKRKFASRIPGLALGQKVAGFSKENCCFRKGIVTFQIHSFCDFFLELKEKRNAPPESPASRWGKNWLVSVRKLGF